MSDDQPHIYLFGTRESVSVDAPNTPIVHWLMGRAVEMTAELQASIRREFMAQEKYRGMLADKFQAMSARFIEASGGQAPKLEYPVATIEEGLERGYEIGKYEAYCEAAQACAEVVKLAAVGAGK